MSKNGPIIIVEDDYEDKEFFEEITREIGIENNIIWFTRADDALDYLRKTAESPFLIFSDINMPGINGLEFKKKIDTSPELRRKSIPFVFFSTSASQQDIDEAYLNMTVQGFFIKGNNYSEVKLLLRSIYYYWMHCKHPNT